MAKISIDIEYIKSCLSNIGYKISDCIEKENNGVNWQIKFSNSGAIVTIYDSNRIGNTVVNGKPAEEEKDKLTLLIAYPQESNPEEKIIIMILNRSLIKIMKVYCMIYCAYLII